MSDEENDNVFVSYADYTPQYLQELKQSAVTAWQRVNQEYNVHDYDDDDIRTMYNNILTKFRTRIRGSIEDHVNFVTEIIQDIRNYKNRIALAITKQKQKLDEVNANWNAKYKGGDLFQDFIQALKQENKSIKYHVINGGKLAVKTFHGILANGYE